MGMSSDSGIRFLERALRGNTIHTPSTINDVDKPGDELSEDLKGPLGLTLLYAPPEPLVDFVFVHGLGGGSRKSWCKTSKPYHYWPKEWLPRDPDFKNVRIHTFGYNSTWANRKGSVLDIHDFSHSLIGELKNNPEIRADDTRIVLIGHSMGGLVIKKVCLLANQDPSFSDLVRRFHTVYFLATPHRGSDLAKHLSNIVKVCFGQKPFVDDLIRNSNLISALNDGFGQCSEHLQLWSFYEAEKSTMLFSDAIVVDKKSATLGYANERVAPLNADHRRFYNSDITTSVTEIRQGDTRNDLRRLRNLLHNASQPIDDLSSLEDARAAGTCEWLTSRKEFEDWRTIHSESPSVLWLSGIPGSGKSILASHVIAHLEGHNLQHCFFFFKHGMDTTSTVADCLRSLAYQICQSSPTARKKLLTLEAEGITINERDEKTLWRKVFLGGIFQTQSVQPQYWVIDALDECDRLEALFSIISKLEIRVPLRIFITSRRTRDIERRFADLGKSVTNLKMKSSDTLEDIKLFIASKIGHLPLSDNKDRENLMSRILSKSAGSFLWVNLVLHELEHAWSKETVNKVLDEIPSDMNMLYARILGNMSKDRTSLKLAKNILTWITCVARPLTTTELQYALKSDIKETIYDMEKSIASVCGQLLYVDQDARVQIIHQTVQDFVLREDSSPEFSIRKESGNLQLAMICLDLLCQEIFEAPKLKKLKPQAKAMSTKESPLARYACYYFSDHLYNASSAEPRIMDVLCKFLNTNVLSWIEFIAKTGDLYHVSRTVTNLKSYLDRQAEHFPATGLQFQAVKAWIVDLIRINAKFNTRLLDSPASIKFLIPSMCPRDSMVAKKFALSYRGLSTKGLQETTWSDCLAQFEYLGYQATATAYGEGYFAVGLSAGQIILYHSTCYQSYRTIHHTERVKVLTFSNCDKLLASSGIHSVRVWDVGNGTQISMYDTSQQVLDMTFSSESDYLIAATQGNYIAYWGLQEDYEDLKFPWNTIGQEPSTILRHIQPPSLVVISSDQNFIGVYYRSQPIKIFDLESETFLGHCIRHSDHVGKGANAHSPVESLVFNPNPEIKLIIAAYADGELVVYDLWTLEVKQCLPRVHAHSMICSPDGRTLVTSGPLGTIELFEFGSHKTAHKLSLIYRSEAFEGIIKSLAFSKDNRRFIDIRGSECRVWEPTVLVQRGILDGSQSDLSKPNPFAPSRNGKMEGEIVKKITAIACHDDGDVVFCGKQDGYVTVFSTQDAVELCSLYQHDTMIVCMHWAENESILATADQGGRIILSTIQRRQHQWSLADRLVDRRFDGAVVGLLMDASSKYLLLSGRDAYEIWSSLESKVSIKCFFPEGFRGAIRHPTHPELFIIFEADLARIYRWADYSEIVSAATSIRTSRAISLQRVDNLSNISYYSGHALLAEFTSTTSHQVSKRLKFWRPSPLSAGSTVSLLPALLDISLLLGPQIEHIITLTDDDTTLLFLDIGLWVCSADLRNFATTRRVERHFFIPPDWRSYSKSPGEFLFYFIKAKREFVFAKGIKLLVIKRGLDYAETISLSNEGRRLFPSHFWTVK